MLPRRLVPWLVLGWSHGWFHGGLPGCFPGWFHGWFLVGSVWAAGWALCAFGLARCVGMGGPVGCALVWCACGCVGVDARGVVHGTSGCIGGLL